MPDLISPILRRSFAFRAVAKDKSKPSYDYAMGLAGSQAMFLVLEKSAEQLAASMQDDEPIRAVIVADTDYTLEHVAT
jgi:hypothetical protein